MKESLARLFLTLIGLTLLVLGDARSSAGQTAVAQTPKRAACTAPEYRQFDFWLGDWDTFESNAPDKVTARNHVDSILDACVLREVYEQNDGLVGQSFTIYDAARKI